MAGLNEGFDSEAFYQAIHFVQELERPEGHGPVFRWKAKNTYAAGDPSGRPYNWNSPPTGSDSPEDYEVPFAYEIKRGSGGAYGSANAVGTFTEGVLEGVLMGPDFDDLVSHGSGRRPDVVVLDDTEYLIETFTPYNLFDAQAWTVEATAADH